MLGTLDPAEAQAVAEQARENAALAAAIAAWQARLAPLSRLATPVTPPPEVWNRIASSAGLREAGHPAAVSPWRAFWDNAVLWRWTTGASLAAAVALLVVALQHPPAPPHQAAALLPTGGAVAAFLAEELPDGGLLLRAVSKLAEGESAASFLIATFASAESQTARIVFAPPPQQLPRSRAMAGVDSPDHLVIPFG